MGTVKTANKLDESDFVGLSGKNREHLGSSGEFDN
jgi:hypothetical protein